METSKFLNEIADDASNSLMEREMARLLECNDSGEIINKAEAALAHSNLMRIDLDESIEYADMVSQEALDLAWFEQEEICQSIK